MIDSLCLNAFSKTIRAIDRLHQSKTELLTPPYGNEIAEPEANEPEYTVCLS